MDGQCSLETQAGLLWSEKSGKSPIASYMNQNYERIFVSADLTLDAKREAFFRSCLECHFANAEIFWSGVKGKSDRSIREETRECDAIVVLFMGYSLKRYSQNLMPLLGLKKPLLGLNPDGDFFEMDPFKVHSILLGAKLEQLFWSGVGRVLHLLQRV